MEKAKEKETEEKEKAKVKEKAREKEMEKEKAKVVKEKVKDITSPNTTLVTIGLVMTGVVKIPAGHGKLTAGTSGMEVIGAPPALTRSPKRSKITTSSIRSRSIR